MLSSSRSSNAKSSPIVSAITSAEISGAERFDRGFAVALVRLQHAQVVPRERVLPVDLDRLAVGGERVVRAAGLVQHDAPLVPQLGRVGDLPEQRLVQLQGGGEVVLEEVDLAHRLQREAAVFAALERQA